MDFQGFLRWWIFTLMEPVPPIPLGDPRIFADHFAEKVNIIHILLSDIFTDYLHTIYVVVFNLAAVDS